MLPEALDLLRCPVCAAALAAGDGALRCPSGHSFDLARQGYVNLVPGKGDDAAMVAAREAFLGAGHYARLGDAIAEEARAADADRGGAVIEIGAGPGGQLARVLDALPGRIGLAIDSSPPALRRAARAHERMAAVGADAWRELPLRDGCAALVLNVFAPRNPPELARVLAEGGALIVVTPGSAHLTELVGALGLLTVPEDKEGRLDAQLGPHFRLAARRSLRYSMFLTREETADLVRMGPSAHLDGEALGEGLAALADPLTVTAEFTLSRFAR